MDLWTNRCVNLVDMGGVVVYWCIIGVTMKNYSSCLSCRERDVSAAASSAAGPLQWGRGGHSQWGYGGEEDEPGERIPPGPGQGLPDPSSPSGLHQARPGSQHHQLMGLRPHCRYSHHPTNSMSSTGFSRELLCHQLYVACFLCFHLWNEWPLCFLLKVPSLSSWNLDLWLMRPAWSFLMLSTSRPSGRFPLTPSWHRRGCSTVPMEAPFLCTWWDSPTASTMVGSTLIQCMQLSKLDTWFH